MSTATATAASLSGCTMQSMVAGTHCYPGMASAAVSTPLSPSTWPSTCLARGSNKEQSQTFTSGKRCDSRSQAADANKGPDGSSVVLLVSVFCPESRPHQQQLLLSPQSSCSRHEGHLQPAHRGRIQAAAALCAGKPAVGEALKERDSARTFDRQTCSEPRNAGEDSRLSAGVVTVSAKRTTAFDRGIDRHSMASTLGSRQSQPVAESPATTHNDQRPAVLQIIPSAKQIAVAAAMHPEAENGDRKIEAAKKASIQCSCTSAMPVKSAGNRCSDSVQRFCGRESSTAGSSAVAAPSPAPTAASAMSVIGRPRSDFRQTAATVLPAVAVAEVCCRLSAPACASTPAVGSPAALQFRRLLSPASCRALSRDLVNNPLFNKLKQQEEVRSCHARQPHPLQPAGNATASPATAGTQPSAQHAAVANSTLSRPSQNAGDATDGTTAASADRSHNRRQRLQQLEERREQLMMNIRGCKGTTDSSHGADGSSHPMLEVFSLHQTSQCS